MKREIILAETVKGLGQAGDRVTLALTPADVHDPAELATYLAGYKPFMFRADEASKPILVNNTQDKYRTFSSDDAFRRVNVKVGDQSPVPEVDPSSSLATYTTVDRLVGSFVSRVVENQTGNNYLPRIAASRRAQNAILLDREIDVWTLLETNTSFASAQRTALGTGYNWNAGINSDPIKDLQTQIENSNQPVTGIWMNQKVGFAFLRHDKVRDHMRQFYGDNAPPISAAQIENAGIQNVDFQLPGFPPIHIVASKVKNESTSAIEYIFNDVVTLLTVPPGVPSDGESIATTYTFRERGGAGTGITVREYVVEDRGREGGTMIAVSMADVAVMTSNNAGGIITGVIA